MRFLEDVIHQLLSCQSAICLGWYAALAVGAFATGLWIARELSVVGAEEIPKVEESTTPAPGWLGLPPETTTKVVLVNAARERVFAAAPQENIAEDESRRGCSLEGSAADDLTLVRGISRMIEAGLVAEGLRTYAEMAECPADRWTEITRILGVSDAAAAGNWMSQARELARLVAMIRDPGMREHRPAREISPALLDGWFAGEEVRQDPKLGPIYGARPSVVDRLTDLEGVTRAWAVALGRIGIYRFKQIAQWTDGEVDEVADRLAIPRDVIDDGAWVARATLRHLDTYRASPIWPTARPEPGRYEELLNQYPIHDAVETDERYGVIYLQPPELRDDLVQIGGIDPGLAAGIGSCGVYRFRQIADWSEANVNAFAVRLEIPSDRIYSDRWIPQAAELTHGAGRAVVIGTPRVQFGLEPGEGIE